MYCWDHKYKVEWDNGKTNSYTVDDLQPLGDDSDDMVSYNQEQLERMGIKS